MVGTRSAVFTAAASVAAASLCDVLYDVNCYGNDIVDSGMVDSEAKCCKNCQTHDGCNAWTWNEAGDWHCWLKKGCSGQKKMQGYRSGAVSAPTSAPTPLPPPGPSPPAPPPSPYICVVLNGVQCYGDDIGDNGAVAGAEECCHACQATKGCEAWTWNEKGDKHCWLKHGCSDRRSSDQYASGTTSKPPPPPPPVPDGFDNLGCVSTTDLGIAGIWEKPPPIHPSCHGGDVQYLPPYLRDDGVYHCVTADGKTDETSITMDMRKIGDREGCFFHWAPDCLVNLHRTRSVEFDFEFMDCGDVWACPLWFTPLNWKPPGQTSGEIDFIEMCPVGSAATNFGNGGQSGEVEKKWGEGRTSKGPQHFKMTFHDNGDLTTRICNKNNPSDCFDGAYYLNFLNVIHSGDSHYFATDLWNGKGGDGGWTGCHARTSYHTHCRFAIMNIKVNSKDSSPAFSWGKCMVLNGATNQAFNSTVEVVV